MTHFSKNIWGHEIGSKIATRIPEMWSTYTKQRNKATQLIRNSIQDHYTGIVEKSKLVPQKTWKTINKVHDKDIKSMTLSNVKKRWESLDKGPLV